MQMAPMTESFVLHFGEMGSRWGFNRTVGQMYGLIVLSEAPLSANDISSALSISRGNVQHGSQGITILATSSCTPRPRGP